MMKNMPPRMKRTVPALVFAVILLGCTFLPLFGDNAVIAQTPELGYAIAPGGRPCFS